MQEKLSEKIKRQAKEIKKLFKNEELKASHMQILHELAQRNGFKTWSALLAEEKLPEKGEEHSTGTKYQ